jgi:hypothetical protein
MFPKTYKQILIPKDTRFFRKFSDTDIHELMFFGFCYVGASSNHTDVPLQLWRTKTEILGNYIVEHISKSNHKKSGLPKLFSLFDGKECDDFLWPKHHNNPNRSKFLEYLKTNGISNWITSVEESYSMELCLFTDDNSALIEFERHISWEDPFIETDSFDLLKF